MIATTARLELEEDDDAETGEIGDDDDEKFEPSQATQEALQSRSQREVFDAWFREKAEAIIEESIGKDVKTEENGLPSLKTLMRRQESECIIGSPRDYQMELFEKAKVQNTIAVLDTGSGKTLIAILLLRHILDQELEDRSMGKERRISFFLTDKVPLAYQQYAVLKANLDCDAEFICGGSQCDLWTREVWEEHFRQNMVIVCTADILVHCLGRSFISIDQINLLIFDEAHHAKKGHPYAKIINEFYLEQPDIRRRPRIFGTTASPVDGNVAEDIEGKARDLENFLHSTITTASDLTVFQSIVKRPTEAVALFDRLPAPVQTSFAQLLRTRFEGFPDFETLYERSKVIHSELGRWCSDKFWSFAFSDRAARKKEKEIQRRLHKPEAARSRDKTDKEIEMLFEAHDFVSSYDIGIPNVSNMSTKAMTLFQHLRVAFETLCDSKCLVFVQTRITASLLYSLAETMGNKNLKPGILIGTAADGQEQGTYTYRQQAITMMKFRKAEINCLFATSVAEEGIDVPECNVVIRFDPCKTVIQYIQSRGRARHQNSKFIHLLERDNWLQEQTLQSIISSEKALRQFYQSLPQERRVDVDDKAEENGANRCKSPRVYLEPSTSAKLTYDFSLVVLGHFVDSIPHDDEDDMSINYVIATRDEMFVCEVILPPKSPLESSIGLKYSKKSVAKRSAAFEACLELRRRNYLDANFLPTYTKKLRSMAHSVLALRDKSSESYLRQSKPSLWEHNRGCMPAELFVTIIRLNEQWERPLRPLCLLTQQRLPKMPQFSVFRTDGGQCQVTLMSLVKSFSINEADLKTVTGFTLAIFKDVFNKRFENNSLKMSYWLAPLTGGHEQANADFQHPSSLIDWRLASYVAFHEPYQWTEDTPVANLIDKFLIDPWDGGRRLFSGAIVKDLNPTDPEPPNCAQGYNTSSIMAYSVKLFRNSRDKRTWNPHQPVLEAEKTRHRLNILAEPTEKERQVITRCFVCPEPFFISLLPTTVAATALLFPAIIHRLESYLLALEFSHELGLDITPSLALEAITKDSENTGDPYEEQINFQPGMGPNYERLEFLGDCFLKMATSISCFIKFPQSDECELHVSRMCMLCNKNLLDVAKSKAWQKYIRSQTFSRRTWYPRGLVLLEGKGANTQQHEAEVYRPLGNKTIADVCEAMIGAALQSHFVNGYGSTTQFDNAVKAVTVSVASPNHQMLTWSEYNVSYSPPRYQTEPANASQRDLARKVQLKHDYEFRYPRLLRSAFYHPSMPRIHENIPSYQRLEFLGDSLLDMAAVTYLFDSFPTKDPQWLTEHKMAMVSNKFLGAVCADLGFHTHLKHTLAGLEHQVKTFVEDLEEAKNSSSGARDYWTTVRDPPKCLPDMVESYVGAIFIDSEFDYAEVQKFFDQHIKWYFEDMSIYDTFANNHPLIKLQKLFGETFGCHKYRLMSQEVPSQDRESSTIVAALLVHDTVVAHGRANSSRYAKIKAAHQGFKILSEKLPYDFRVEYRCDCSHVAESTPPSAPEIDVGTSI